MKITIRYVDEKLYSHIKVIDIKNCESVTEVHAGGILMPFPVIDEELMKKIQNLKT